MNDIKAPPSFSDTAASLPLSRAAASNIGCTGAGHARNSYARHFTSGHSIRSRTQTGRASIMSSSVQGESDGIQRSVHSPFGGFVSFSVAGRIASRTTRPSTNKPWQRAGRVRNSRLQLWNSSGKKSQGSAKLHPLRLDRRPQMSILRSALLCLAAWSFRAQKHLQIQRRRVFTTTVVLDQLRWPALK